MYICRRFCRSGTVAAVIPRACMRPVSTRPHLGKARMTDAAKGPGSLNWTMSTTRLSASRSSSMCWVLDNPMSPTTLAPDARSSQARTFSLATRSLNFLGFANRLKWSGTLVPGSKSTDLELPASCVTWNPSRCKWAARAVLPTRPGPAPATMTFGCQALCQPLVESGPTQLVDALLHFRAGRAPQASLARPSQAHASGTRHFAIARCKFPHGQAVKVQGHPRACRSRYSDPQSYILQAHDIHVFLYAYTYICLHNIIHYYREKCALLSG